MIKVGITGGIGSGKSIICQCFAVFGIPIYNADNEAKKLYHENDMLKEKICFHFGNDIYKNNKFNKDTLAKIVFADAEKLKILNALVHPLLIEAGEKWFQYQTSIYAIKEAAIMIESGSYKSMDKIISVEANVKLRKERALKRDQNEEQINQRIAAQLSDEERKKYANYTIVNDDTKSVIEQVLEIHNHLISI